MSTFGESIDQVLRSLDAAPEGPGELFPSQASKDRYESLLLFSLRRFDAATYHLDRVHSILEEYQAYVQQLEPPSGLSGHGQLRQTSTRISGKWDASKLEFEFSAFVAAIKTSLDFLATAVMWHLKGMDGDSISDLIKLAGRGWSGPLFDEVKTATDWLLHIRGYRDHLLHRLLINLTSGFHLSAHGDRVARTVFPVLVPSETPKYVPDTRGSRMMSLALDVDNLPNSIVSESTAWIEYPDGRVETRSHTRYVEPAAGYRPIQEQMQLELDKHAEFANAVLRRVLREGMNAYTVSSP